MRPSVAVISKTVQLCTLLQVPIRFCGDTRYQNSFPSSLHIIVDYEIREMFRRLQLHVPKAPIVTRTDLVTCQNYFI
jgi:hypothetical protein